MQCQNCGKNEATTHIKRIINGEATQSHLCQKCARQLGYNDFFGDLGFNLSDVFTGLFGDNPLSLKQATTKRCDNCGCSFEDIIKTGRVGCAACYETFYDKLLPSIQRIHGRAKHTGKIPKTPQEQNRQIRIEPTPQERLQQLNEQMDQAVSVQNFELAAELRDEIKKIKEGLV